MSALAQQIRQDNPVAYWPMDESSGTTLADRSGNGRNLMLTGGYSLYQPMGPLRGVNFNGSSGYASRASEAWMDLSATYSLEAWVWIDVDPTLAEAVYGVVNRDRNVGDANGGPAWRMWVFSSAHATLPGHAYGATTNAANSTIESSLGTMAVGRLHHIVVSANGAQQITYLDGVGSTPVASTHVPATTARQLVVGRAQTSVADRFFDGKISNVAIYGSGLTAERVQAHYRAGLRSGVVY